MFIARMNARLNNGHARHGPLPWNKIMKNFKTEFYRSIRNTMHKISPKICTGYSFSAAKIYLYHKTKIAKARPHVQRVGIS